jgi:hypothetical protein
MCHSDWWVHHKLLPGHMGQVKWHESELWHSGGHLRRGFRYRHCSATLWQEVESEEWCPTICDRLMAISHTAAASPVSWKTSLTTLQSHNHVDLLYTCSKLVSTFLVLEDHSD